MGRFWCTLGSQVWWRGQLRFTPRSRNLLYLKMMEVVLEDVMTETKVSGAGAAAAISAAMW